MVQHTVTHRHGKAHLHGDPHRLSGDEKMVTREPVRTLDPLKRDLFRRKPRRHPNPQRAGLLQRNCERGVRVDGFDLDGVRLVIEQQIDTVPRVVKPRRPSIPLAKRSDGPTHDIQVEQYPVKARQLQWFVPVGCWEPEPAAQSIRYVAAAVQGLRIRRRVDKARVPQLRRQQVAPQHSFRILEICRPAPAPQDEGGLHQIAG